MVLTSDANKRKKHQVIGNSTRSVGSKARLFRLRLQYAINSPATAVGVAFAMLTLFAIIFLTALPLFDSVSTPMVPKILSIPAAIIAAVYLRFAPALKKGLENPDDVNDKEFERRMDVSRVVYQLNPYVNSHLIPERQDRLREICNCIAGAVKKNMRLGNKMRVGVSILVPSPPSTEDDTRRGLPYREYKELSVLARCDQIAYRDKDGHHPRYPISDVLAGYAIKDRRPSVAYDIHNDDRWVRIREDRKYRCLLSIPIDADGKGYAAITIDWPVPYICFDSEESIIAEVAPYESLVLLHLDKSKHHVDYNVA